jgi:DNA-3-methyladenine glycosylase II
MVKGPKSGQILLPVPDNFDFDQCLQFLDRNADECLHRVESGCWIKPIKISQVPVLLQVRKESKYLVIRALNVALNQIQQEALRHYVLEVFDLNTDLTGFYQAMDKDPILKDLIQQYHGLRLLGIPDLFEALCWCIIGQQINLSFAYRLKKRLVRAVGEKLHYQGTDYYFFPTAEVISKMITEDFSEWQFSTSKASYLIGTAKQLQTGNLSKQKLMTMKAHQAQETLMELKGIGTWSAQYVMMKCLRINTAFPVTDVGLQNAIRFITGSSDKPSMEEMQEFSKNWHPWQAYATFYLWHSLII